MRFIATIGSLHAERQVPRMFYVYAGRGSWTEGTRRANEREFAKIKFRQWMLITAFFNLGVASLIRVLSGAAPEHKQWF